MEVAIVLMVQVVLEINSLSMRLFFVLLTFCSLFVSCDRTTNATTKMFTNAVDMKEQMGEYKTIDLSRTATMTSDQYADLVKEIKYIPLKMGRIPIGAINDIFINNKYIVLLDGQKSKSIFVYDWQGNVKCIISAKGHGRGEYLVSTSVEIETKTGFLCVKDDRQSKFLYYDMNGKFMKEEKTIASVYSMHLGKCVINQLAVGQTYDRNVNFNIALSQKDSVISKGFPYYNIQIENVMPNKFEFNYKHELLYLPFASDSVYCLANNSSYSVKYVFKNKNSLWKYKNEKLSFDETVKKIKTQNLNRISTFHETENYIFYSIYCFDKKHDRIMNKPFLYDKAKDVSYSVLDIPKGEIKLFAPMDLLCVFDKWCVGFFNPYVLKKKMGTDYFFSNIQLANVVKASSLESNPVLVFYKMK